MRQARQWLQDARRQKIGIFAADDPLRIEPFEVRYLAGRRAPNRWVIDLSKNDDILIDPQEYYRNKNIEDRLFIPEEFVSLFTEAGWEKQS